MIQTPATDNDETAIVRASVMMRDKQGYSKTFTGIGDASPQNVSRNIVPHLIRMAETRAKARALRDAINVTEALLDDPTSEGESDHTEGQNSVQNAGQNQGQSGGRRRSRSNSSSNEGSDERSDDGEHSEDPPASKSRKNYLHKIIEGAGWSIEEWEDAHQIIETMTQSDAQKAIQEMQKQ